MMPIQRRKFLHLTAAVNMLPTWVAAQQSLRPVALALWSKPITEIAHLLAETEQEFFQKQGIELKMIPGSGGGDALRHLLGGQADIAFTDPGSLFSALAQGEKLRIIYDIYPKNVFNVVSLKSAGLTHPGQLKGKRVGVYSLASGTRLNLQLLLAQVGLAESDITLVVTGLLNFAPLMQGQVDATAATDTGLAVARARGLSEFNIFDLHQTLPLSSDLLVVRDETYRLHKAMLRSFVLAWRNSVNWAMAHPEQAALTALQRAIDGQNLDLNREIVRLRNLSSQSAYTLRHGLGAIDTVSLEAGAQAYLAAKLIPRLPDIKAAVVHDLLP